MAPSRAHLEQLLERALAALLEHLLAARRVLVREILHSSRRVQCDLLIRILGLEQLHEWLDAVCLEHLLLAGREEGDVGEDARRVCLHERILRLQQRSASHGASDQRIANTARRGAVASTRRPNGQGVESIPELERGSSSAAASQHQCCFRMTAAWQQRGSSVAAAWQQRDITHLIVAQPFDELARILREHQQDIICEGGAGLTVSRCADSRVQDRMATQPD